MKYNNQQTLGDVLPAEFDEFYSQLPRFGEKLTNQSGESMGSRKVSFNWQDADYELITHPAQLQIENQEDRYLLPGKREKAVEQAILHLSRESRHFDSQTLVVTFTSAELEKAMRANCGEEYSDRELEEAIHVLAHAQYRLIIKNEVFPFHSLNPVRQKTSGNDLLFQVRPTSFVFGSRLRAFCED